MPEPDAVDAWERLVRFHRLATKAMDRRFRTEYGRSLDDYDVLHQIHLHAGPIRMGELAERLLVANSSCNRIVGRLADAGLIARSHGEHDRREVLVALTPEGARLHRRMAAAHTRDIRRLMGSTLDADDLAVLDQLLGRLLEGG